MLEVVTDGARRVSDLSKYINHVQEICQLLIIPITKQMLIKISYLIPFFSKEVIKGYNSVTTRDKQDKYLESELICFLKQVYKKVKSSKWLR